MCGIAGIYLKNRHLKNPHIPTEDLLDGLLLGIEHRGRDATGMVAVSKEGKNVTFKKEPRPASEFIVERPPLPPEIKTILLHTRWATKGDPDKNENNHPVICNSTFVTHNGHINNDDTMFRRLEKKRGAEVDSIIIPTILDEFGLNTEEGKKYLGELWGNMAIAAINPVSNPDDLLLLRGENSPLVILETDKFIMWASEKKSIELAYTHFYGTAPAHRRFTYLNEGWYWFINDDKIEKERFVEYERYQYQGYRGQTWERRDAGRSNQEMCWECGERPATKVMTDSYTDSDGDLHEWDYHTCVRCFVRLDPKDPDFSYRHVTERGASHFRVTKKEDLEKRRRNEAAGKAAIEADRRAELTDDPKERCGLCFRFKATGTDKTGRRVCGGCLLWEQRHDVSYEREAEVAREFAHVTLTDRIKELEIGDSLPEDLIQEFGKCEDCWEYPPEVVGIEHTAQCTLCRNHDITKIARDGESDSGTEEVLAVCDGCSKGLPEDDVKVSIWGALCGDCRNKTAKTKKEAVEKWERLSRGEFTLHERACVYAARKLNTTTTMIDWVIFRCPPRTAMADPELSQIKKDAEAAYATAFRIAREAVRK